MAIDHIIDYDCVPKQTLTSEGILQRLKGLERANTIIQMFREHGDERDPSDMGFEMSRSTPEGETERRLIVVQDLLDAAADLKPLESHCAGCPANVHKRPFGCMGFVRYPISSTGEQFLLKRLPTPSEPLVWLLLKQGVENFYYDGEKIRALRESSDVYFEDRYAKAAVLGEIQMDANQVFEMIFSVGPIKPNHAGVLLLFFRAIAREKLDAPEIMSIAPAGPDATQTYPFIIELDDEADDDTIRELKSFLYALYTAWALNVALLVDA